MEAYYLFCKVLAAFIRPVGETRLDLGKEVELTYLRTEQTFAGSVALRAEHGEVSTIFSGAGKQVVVEEEPLSQIIVKLNDRFNTDFRDSDRVHLDTIFNNIAERPDVQRAAAANTPENFKLFITKIFTDEIVRQLDVSQDLSLKLIDNSDARDLVLDTYLKLIQGKAKVAWQEHCPIGGLLGPDREGQYLEYKSTLRVAVETGELYKPLESMCLKTIAAFANSRDGGTLLIGVTDSGTPYGLEPDYRTLRKPDKDDRDLFQLHLNSLIAGSMGPAAAANVTMQIHTVDEADICRVHVHPSGFPVDTKVTIDKAGQMVKKTMFYVRTSNSTLALDGGERAKYILTRWPSS